MLKLLSLSKNNYEYLLVFKDCKYVVYIGKQPFWRTDNYDEARDVLLTQL